MLSRVVLMNEEDGMRQGIILAIAGAAFLTGCGNWGNKPYMNPAATQAKIPYHIELDTKPAKPSAGGVTLPGIVYTANSKVLERRGALVVRFDASGTKNDQPGKDQLITSPFDMSGSAGNLPANAMDLASMRLAKLFADRCMNGKVKINVVLVRSSIKPDATDAEINAKRLSDWLATEVEFKNPHPKKC
jgi:hypothetical protein